MEFGSRAALHTEERMAAASRAPLPLAFDPPHDLDDPWSYCFSVLLWRVDLCMPIASMWPPRANAAPPSSL